MASHILDADKFRRLATCQGMKTQPEMSATSKVPLRTLVKALAKKSVNDETIQKLASSVGLGNNYHELILWESPLPTAEGGVEFVPTVLMETAGDQQDVKLVIASRSVSRSLLAIKEMPSFADCLRATKVWTPIDDAHKDHPYVPDMPYNHFLQPSVLVTLDVKNRQSVVAYARLKAPLQPSNVHTGGMSILFGASWMWHVTRQRKTPLDYWIALTSDPEEAKKQLLQGTSPFILQFVRYKIDLLRHPCRILPLGVITKDERKGNTRRVYTQFVFHVRVQVKNADTDDLLRQVSVDGSKLYCLSPTIDPEKSFVGEQNHVNLMDLVAWRSLNGRAQRDKCGGARFWRDFRVV